MKNNKITSPQTDKKNESSGEKKKGTNKFLFLGLGTIAVGVLSYFGWNYWKDHSSSPQTGGENKDITDESVKPKTSHTSTTKHSTSSKTAKATTGKQSKPNKGTTSTQQKQTTNTSTAHNEKLDAANLAMQLAKSAMQKQYLKTVTLLNSLKNVTDYNAVNAVFKTYRVNGVRQTLVNALLSTFTIASQKLIIKAQFLRIGLKHNLDTDKWSLSGIENPNTLITISKTQVWKSPKHSVTVPQNMVLGSEVTKRGNYTLFENEQEYYLVPSAHIKNYRP